MSRRHFTNPPPLTESAREAAKNFYCDLCKKGYSRHDEYDKHLSSYDHNHKQRFINLKETNQQMQTKTSTIRKTDDGGVIKKIDETGVKIGTEGRGTASGEGSGLGPGFKRAGFRSTFRPVQGIEGTATTATTATGTDAATATATAPVKSEESNTVEPSTAGENSVLRNGESMETEDNESEDDPDAYDPERPTGCPPNCPGHRHG